ncbi:hydantoinase oxoprolinase [Secundilactobacillus kimchicus JCM 15530]|uniref:Hydantoinase oxoprolinase n=1 Tax=Secundilactobacillus kimchicus JCM 15530 TaxID=1302272 RepID=A0A0R1HPJ5_9LACO|nr:hydantoinase/oxoprolinase family protein [Secundilactobacillus kimchicus]KRK48376.1 hydantoinase oxoprolinase [Secundilactobacillus kimchicus JCM 15530]
MYRLGIDVGGTNTDAIILNDRLQVIASVKAHTTQNIESGIFNALTKVLQLAHISPSEITQAMLGTTQCTNAIVERKHLAKVGVLRVGYPATASVPPYTAWPEDMVEALGGYTAIVDGGFETDGRVLNEIDKKQIVNILSDWKGKVESVAITGVFSSVNDEQEEVVGKLAKQMLGEDVPVSLSSKIGSLGLIERENATILNASLAKVIQNTVDGFKKALENEGVVNARLYLCQNDGTLMSSEFARRYPILTIGSGPTNSIRGAAYLAEIRNAIVVDVGGTTTDLGVLQNGFPRESSLAIEVGGITTNFRMPDVISIGLGGGSIVTVNDDGSVSVGPKSVGYKIVEEAITFGGDTLTATDVAVRLGMSTVGNPERVAKKVDLGVAEKAMEEIKRMVEDAVDKMKTNANDASIVLVGGGSIIVPEKLAGVSKAVKDQLGSVANAIGASIAQISGQIEQIYVYSEQNREESLNDAQRQAADLAKEAGADANTLELVEVEEIPIAYNADGSTKVRVKIVGDLS